MTDLKPILQLFAASLLTVLISTVVSFLNVRYQYLPNSPITLVQPVIAAIIGIYVYFRLVHKAGPDWAGKESVVFGLVTAVIWTLVWGSFASTIWGFDVTAILANVAIGFFTYTGGALVCAFILRLIGTPPRKQESSPLPSRPLLVTGSLRADEKVLWRGKPEIVPFFVPDTLPVLIAVQGLIFLYGATSVGGFLAQRLGQLVGQLIGLLPFVIGLGYLIRLLTRDYLRYRNTEYAITDQRLIAQTGASWRTMSIELNEVKKAYVKTGQVDSLFGTGTLLVLTDGLDSTLNLRSLKEPGTVQRLLLDAVEQDPRGNQLIPIPKALGPSPPLGHETGKDGEKTDEQGRPGFLKRLRHIFTNYIDNMFGMAELMEGLSERLLEIGVNATLMERDGLGPTAMGHTGYTLGCMKVEGRSIDWVQVGCLSKSSGDDGPPTYLTNVFLYNYVVVLNPEDSERDIEADFEPLVRRRGVFQKEVVGFHWKGARLAEALSKDSDLTRMILGLGLERLEIRLGRGYRASWRPKVEKGKRLVGITPISPLAARALAKGPLRDYREVGREDLPTREAFETYDRIARHIHSVAGSVRNEAGNG